VHHHLPLFAEYARLLVWVEEDIRALLRRLASCSSFLRARRRRRRDGERDVGKHGGGVEVEEEERCHAIACEIACHHIWQPARCCELD
jgi:hypothetical protein